MLNPTHLRTLLEVLRTGSFAAAAGGLGVTASAVSQQMTALEKATSAALFTRNARSAIPTEAARVLARHAVKVLTDIDALLASTARARDETAEELRLGIFPSLATYALPRLLGTPRWESLGIALKVFVTEPAQAVQGLRAGGELDLALIFQVGQAALAWPTSLTRQWIADDPFQVVVPASWGIADGSTVNAEQLADMPWIMHHPGTADAIVIHRLFNNYNLRPPVAAYSDDFNASLAMVSAGLGAALVPDLARQNPPTRLATLEVPEIRLVRSIFALRPEQKSQDTDQHVRVSAFLDQLAQALARPQQR